MELTPEEEGLLGSVEHGEWRRIPDLPAAWRVARRITDEDATWRIVRRIDADAIVIAEVFAKKTQATPRAVIAACQRRLRTYDSVAGEKE